jgi:hypothetical protein
MKDKNKIQKNKGAAMIIIVFFFVFISLTILMGIVTPVVREFKIATDNLDSKQSYFIAESGAEDIVYRMKNNLDIGTVGEERTLFLNNSFFPIPTEVTDLGGGRKQITTMGEVDENERKVDLTLTTSTGVSFNYGVLVGQGGITLEGSGTIKGNVYANGPITGDSSAIITGTAISANSPDVVADQSNGTGIPAYNVVFGDASDSTQDIAQSFRVESSSPLNKVELYIKRTTTVPSTTNLKIMNDSAGSVGSTILAQGTIPSSVTTTYGWIEVSLDRSPLLDTSKTYWLVIDAPKGSATKNFIIGASNGGYDNGLGKIGKLGSTWNNTTPSGLDYYFKIYLGGINGKIYGSSLSQWNQLHIGTESGTAQAHEVNYTNSTGNIYCKIGTGNNKSCIDQPDPTYIAYPISEANIEEWKTDATSGGVINSSYTIGPWPDQNITLGPKKILGNLTVTSGGTLTVSGTLWVTGNIVLDGGGLIKLASTYNENDGVILADGTITITGGGHASGSGTVGSYLMLLSLSDSDSAMSVSGGSGAVIVYAPNGTITISGGASLKEATGYKMLIKGGSTITYESGLTNNNFSSGPSGSWSIDSWKETE